MIEFRHRHSLSIDVQLDDRDAAHLLTMVARALHPGLEQSVGAVDWHNGRECGRDWIAEGLLPDGFLIYIVFRPNSREFTLLITNALKPPQPPRLWHNFILIGLAILGLGVGIHMQSVLWAALTALGGVGAWAGVDIALQIRSERRIDRRGIDSDHWRRRLEHVVDSALQANTET